MTSKKFESRSVMRKMRSRENPQILRSDSSTFLTQLFFSYGKRVAFSMLQIFFSIVTGTSQ